MKFIKKPIPVETVQWFMQWFMLGDVEQYYRADCSRCDHPGTSHGWIDTLEGGHIVCPGDWIITGVRGEQYPCKPDIFEETYDAIK